MKNRQLQTVVNTSPVRGIKQDLLSDFKSIDGASFGGGSTSIAKTSMPRARFDKLNQTLMSF